MDHRLTKLIIAFIVIAALWEIIAGRTKNGHKTREDWLMAFLSAGIMVTVQRPLLLLIITVGLGALLPHSAGSLAWLDKDYFVPTLLGFFFVEEFLHASAHYFAHCRRPKNRVLQWLQAFYKMSHRPHHLNGGSDDRGQISVTQTFNNGWGWWMSLPNYWWQLTCLYLGLVDVFLVGTTFKGLWAAHCHVNWNYDLYFLNHKWAWVRKTMRALAHLLVFPTQHHHHHARGRNSAKNIASTLALYDWLVFKTLAIESERPAVYGWRQSADESNVLKRYFKFNLRSYMPPG